MTNLPLISIITPTYNHERFIAECIASAQAQTYSNWEMLIIDDGSTDETWQTVQSFAAIDPRIRPFCQSNKGIWRLAENYNLALGHAQGSLVAILEGDDYWPVDTLEILVNQISVLDDSYGVVYGQSESVGIRQGVTSGRSEIPNVYEIPAQFAHQIYTPIANIPPQAAIIRKSALDSIGGFIQPRSLPLVDRPTFLALSMLYKFYHIHKVLAFWRQHDSNATRILSLRMAAGAIPWICTFFDSLDEMTIEKLTISRDRAIKIHRQRVFAMSAVYLQNIENEKSLDDRCSEVLISIFPYIGIMQRVVLLIEMMYLKIGMDLRWILRLIIIGRNWIRLRLVNA